MPGAAELEVRVHKFPVTTYVLGIFFPQPISVFKLKLNLRDELISTELSPSGCWWMPIGVKLSRFAKGPPTSPRSSRCPLALLLLALAHGVPTAAPARRWAQVLDFQH